MGDAYTKEAYKLIYQHPNWQSTAQEYEDKFAANLYNSSPVQQAATMALTRLSETLTAYYRLKNLNQEQAEDLAAIGEVAEQISGRSPDDWRVLEGALLQRNSKSGAGQIGRWQMGEVVESREAASVLGIDLEEGASYPLFNPADADRLNWGNIQNVFTDGNLREQMTMLYNGMFINGGKTKEEIEQSRSLKNLLLNITPEDMKQMHDMGVSTEIPFELLKEMGHYDKKEDLFDTYSMARDLKRGKDKLKNRGNWFTRWTSGIQRAFSAAFSSKFHRSNKKKAQQKGLGLEHYERLDIGLSEREMINGLDEKGNLMWKEGQSYFRMDTPVTAEGMLQTAGPSGTTLRMLGAYRLLGASKNELLMFRLALIAWMVSSRDHSLYEILVGSHNAGVKGREDLSEAANMYRTIDPLFEELIRQEYAPNHRFPHETIYLEIIDEHMKDIHGENGGIKNPENAEDIFEGESAYGYAAKMYSGNLYKIMNTSDKYGETAGRIRVWLLDKVIPANASEEDKKKVIGSQKKGYEVAKLSHRMLSDAMEVLGSAAPRVEEGHEELEEYDPLRAEQDRRYQAQWMDMSHAFRGITYRGGKLTSAMRKKGSFVTNSFLSTSLLTSTAMHFYNLSKEKDENRAVFRFRMEGKGAINIAGNSSYRDEMEVLIPRGATFQVLDTPKPAYYNKVTQEIIEEERLTEGEKAAVLIDLEQGEESFWQRCQIVDLQEMSAPGEQRRLNSAEKNNKRIGELIRMIEMAEAQHAG